MNGDELTWPGSKLEVSLNKKITGSKLRVLSTNYYSKLVKIENSLPRVNNNVVASLIAKFSLSMSVFKIQKGLCFKRRALNFYIKIWIGSQIKAARGLITIIEKISYNNHKGILNLLYWIGHWSWRHYWILVYNNYAMLKYNTPFDGPNHVILFNQSVNIMQTLKTRRHFYIVAMLV